MSGDLNSLENMYFNPQADDSNDILNEVYETYPNGEKRVVYDPHKEMEEIKQGSGYQIQNSHLPQAILESFMAKPLDMPVPNIIDQDVMNEQLQNRTLDIIDKLDSRDKQGKQVQKQTQTTINEETTHNPTTEIDYKFLATLIEGILDRKLASFSKTILNESRGGQNIPQMAFMKLGNSFTFMDDANNVYECKLIYKGKGKVKKQ